VAVTAPGGSRNAVVIGGGYSIDHAASRLATAVRAGEGLAYVTGDGQTVTSLTDWKVGGDGFFLSRQHHR
jgi:hypothetical protein